MKAVVLMDRELRTCPRVEISLPVKYKYLEKGSVFHALEGRAENIGAKGMAMVNDHEIESGQKLLVTLLLPAAPARVDRASGRPGGQAEAWPVIFLSQATWCRRQGDNAYRVGVQFLVSDQNHLKRFKQFLDALHIDQPVTYGEMPDRSDENEP
jgi:hypothetical protein